MNTRFGREICLTVWLLLFCPSFSFAGSYGRGENGDAFISFFWFFFVISVVFYLIFREVNCWYWKVNERLSVEKETRDLLEDISIKLSNLSVCNSPAVAKTVENKLRELTKEEKEIVAKVKEVIDMYLKEDYSFKHGEELDKLIKRKSEKKCLHCGKRLTGISSFCNTSHREAFFNSIDKYVER